MTVRALADELHTRLLDASPLFGSSLGLRQYDPLVPDASAEGERLLAADVVALLARLRTVEPATLSAADAVTLACAVETAEATLAELAAATVEHVVTPLPFAGPAVLLAVLARTVLPDAKAAEDFLTRLRGSGDYVRQLTDRLVEGAERGRFPVESLALQAISWVDALLEAEHISALHAPAPPEELAADWGRRVGQLEQTVLRPALVHWRDTVRDRLVPAARSDDHAGLLHLPGGAADYERLIRVHTTLPLTAEELHQRGLAAIERLTAQLVELGAGLGLADLPAVLAAVRGAAAAVSVADAFAGAEAAVRRAEGSLAGVFAEPLPPECRVAPMPDVVGEAGTPPHYTPPTLDGTRPGTYWFNTVRPTAGTGWDTEAVAFHEAVPGHHLQLCRQQQVAGLPPIQSQWVVTAYAEGWGLYSERLAGEMGLYSDDRQRIGAITAEMFRAARLVIDTGLHAFGWSRARAVQYFMDHVAMSEAFLAAEVDRYLAMPGQALAYLTGQAEMLRLRDEARAKAGDRFDLAGFHAAVLDSGSVPLPVLAVAVDRYVAGLTA